MGVLSPELPPVKDAESAETRAPQVRHPTVHHPGEGRGLLNSFNVNSAAQIVLIQGIPPSPSRAKALELA